MKKDSYTQLMHREIDGLNSADDSRRLAAYLREDDEARRYYDELRSAVALLEQAAPCEPPPGLLRSILAAVAATMPLAAPSRPRRRPGVAAAFAAGLVIGMVLLGAVWPRLRGESTPAFRDLYGSAAPAAVVARNAVIDEKSVTGRAQAWFSADHVTVRVDLAAEGAVRLELSHDAGLVVGDVRVLGPAAPRVDFGAGRVVLEYSGKGSFEIVLKGGASARHPLIMAVWLDGTPLLERVIDPEQEGA